MVIYALREQSALDLASSGPKILSDYDCGDVEIDGEAVVRHAS